MRIIIAARAFAAPDQGGATWAALQWVLGLRTLGHDVLLVEPVAAGADAARLAPIDRCAHRVTDRFGLHGRVALLLGDGRSRGMPYREVLAFATTADVLINLGGIAAHADVWGPVARRVYVDLDPGFTQLWRAEAVDVGLADHDVFLTVGQCIGTPGSPVPTGGIRWHPVLPPVALDAWPVCDDRPTYGWTTVANWRSYGSVWRAGVHYGQKAHSFRALGELPSRVSAAVFQPAIAIHPGDDADRAALDANGWRLLDPRVVAGDVDSYAGFVRASTGEIGVAKSGYVAGRTGWFSDRSACYLASGRPVVAQDTGWASVLPVGEGLLSFHAADEAAGGVADVHADYARHAKAARALALDLFDARVVLPPVLDLAGAA